MTGVDLLASEYGWARDDIYPLDFFNLQEVIKRRRFNEYRIQAWIIQNPHVKDHKELWNFFDKESPPPRDNDEFDEMGFERLKQALGSSDRFKVINPKKSIE